MINRQNKNDMNCGVDNDVFLEREEVCMKKKFYRSPSLTEVGKINKTTKGKNVVGPDIGGFFES